MRASQARKQARDAHAAVKRAAELQCCGITFSGKVALRIHKRQHKQSIYPD